MKIKMVLLVMLLFGVSGAVVAQQHVGRYGFTPRAQVQQPGPAEVLEQGLNRLIDFMGQEQRPGRKRQVMFVERQIAPYFDFDYMARWAGGQLWRQLDKGQRYQLKTQLKQQFLATLVQKLSAFGGQKVNVLRVRQKRGGEVSVGVIIMNPQGYPAKLNFRFYQSSTGWKIFDVSANGNSALMHFRRHFKRMMQPRQNRRAYPMVR